MDYKIEIGQKFLGKNQNIVIIDREIRKDKKGRNWKWYRYLCNNCGWDGGWNTEHHILNGVGCSCCRGFTVVRGINDVATTHPEYVKYFVNEEDAYNITYSSSKLVLLKCPNCGTQKLIRMDQFHKYGLACNKCSDGISYSEKFMFSFLQQINIDFNTQLGKKQFGWCNNYYYDFYVPDYNCIIETHGDQHYIGYQHYGFKSAEYEQENDRRKKELAIENGITNYFELDCRKSNMEYMKMSIINSGLLAFFNINEDNVDWNKCQEYTTTSQMVMVCNYKNEHPELSSVQIADVFHMNKCTIQRYMRRGAELGICIYKPKRKKVA